MQADLWDIARGPRAPLDLDRVRRRAGASARRRRVIAGVLALALALGLVAITVQRRAATTTTPRPAPASPPPTFTVESVRGLDAIVVLGAPVGPESTGTLVAIDPATGVVLRRDHRGGLSPGDFPTP